MISIEICFVSILLPRCIVNHYIKVVSSSNECLSCFVLLFTIKLQSYCCQALHVTVSTTAECTFDYFVGSQSTTCGWNQDHSGADQFDWSRARGSTASYQTGPSFDHTYGTNQGTPNVNFINTVTSISSDPQKVVSKNCGR